MNTAYQKQALPLEIGLCFETYPGFFEENKL